MGWRRQYGRDVLNCFVAWVFDCYFFFFANVFLRHVRSRRWLGRGFAGAEGEAVGHYVHQDQGEHEDGREPDSPVAVGALPEVMAGMLVIARLGALVFCVVAVCAHLI